MPEPLIPLIPAPLSLVVLAATDEAAHETALAGLLLELPDAVSLRYRHRWVGEDEPGVLHVQRVVGDRDGRLFVDNVTGAYDCACCCVEDDLVETLGSLVEQRRWRQIVVSPPLGAPVAPLAASLARTIADARLEGVRLGAVVSVVDQAGLDEVLFGDALLDERRAALSGRDRRSVGESVTEHVEYADLVVGVNGNDAEPAGSTALLERLAHGQVLADWSLLSGPDVLRGHDVAVAARRSDPLWSVPAAGAEAGGPVWTLQLGDDRPLHPDRLLARLEDLALGRFRSRGVFWLPSRPETPCAWDGVGGQLSVGPMEGWGDRAPVTRLTITGTDPADRERVRAAFDEVVLRPEEEPEWSAHCSTREDGFEPWLGERELTR